MHGPWWDSPWWDLGEVREKGNRGEEGKRGHETLRCRRARHKEGKGLGYPGLRGPQSEGEEEGWRGGFVWTASLGSRGGGHALAPRPASAESGERSRYTSTSASPPPLRAALGGGRGGVGGGGARGGRLLAGAGGGGRPAGCGAGEEERRPPEDGSERRSRGAARGQGRERGGGRRGIARVGRRGSRAAPRPWRGRARRRGS